MFSLLRGKPQAEREYPAGQLAVTDPDIRKRIDFLRVTAADLGVIRAWALAKAGASARKHAEDLIPFDDSDDHDTLSVF